MSGRKPCGEHDVAELADILKPFITKYEFVSYGSDMDKTPLNPVALLPHKKLLVKLFRVSQEIGPISASDMKSALQQAAEQLLEDPCWLEVLNLFVRFCIRFVKQNILDET